VIILFSQVESYQAPQVREATEDSVTSFVTRLELRRSDKNEPETRTNAGFSHFATPQIAELGIIDCSRVQGCHTISR